MHESFGQRNHIEARRVGEDIATVHIFKWRVILTSAAVEFLIQRIENQSSAVRIPQHLKVTAQSSTRKSLMQGLPVYDYKLKSGKVGRFDILENATEHPGQFKAVHQYANSERPTFGTGVPVKGRDRPYIGLYVNAGRQSVLRRLHKIQNSSHMNLSCIRRTSGQYRIHQGSAAGDLLVNSQQSIVVYLGRVVLQHVSTGIVSQSRREFRLVQHTGDRSS
jgi:hypothetical protein